MIKFDEHKTNKSRQQVYTNNVPSYRSQLADITKGMRTDE